MVASSSPKPNATYADLEALPENVRGEILDGTLYVQPRARPLHQAVITAIVGELDGPFQRGRGGFGGWILLCEPGLWLPGSPEVVPDVAGWRRARMADVPDRRIEVVPDWVCEVLSPTNRGYDLRIKRPFYARHGVKHLWYVDTDSRTVTVSRLFDGKWVEVAIHGEDDVMKAEPFDVHEIALSAWWPAAVASPA